MAELLDFNKLNMKTIVLLTVFPFAAPLTDIRIIEHLIKNKIKQTLQLQKIPY